MKRSLADIFRLYPGLDDFVREVMQLEGQFDLSRSEMEALGQAYFEKHPERYVQRNLDEVRIGYQLTRFCLLERAMAGLPPEVKDFFRQAFDRPDSISRLLEEKSSGLSSRELSAWFESLQTKLNELKATVDELPKGMIKERFLGGLSTIFNVCYLLKIFLERSGRDSLQE
ncbi:MAG: hypothetical protein WBI18_04175 [Candidatus Saccharicenans sp.]